MRSIMFLCCTLIAAVALGGCASHRTLAPADVVSGSSSDDVLVADDVALVADDAPTQVVYDGAQRPTPRYAVAALPPHVFGAASDRAGCGLPCEGGGQQWHVRGLFGRAFFSGTDEASDCTYWGADLGTNFCGSCWGIDAFFRRHSGRFDRMVPGGPNGRDGGNFNHIGLKLTFQQGISNSNFYWWFGIGPAYFESEDYLVNDDGFGVFGEIGLGYNFSRNVRLRGGVNVHGFDTVVGRLDPADDGNSRFLLVFAPVIGLELSF